MRLDYPLFQSHPLFESPPAGRISACLWDLSSPTLPEDVSPGGVDIVVMIFVLSALHPNEWRQAIENVHTARTVLAMRMLQG